MNNEINMRKILILMAFAIASISAYTDYGIDIM